jgi:phosphatidylinositol alpha-mannosyltransferase
MHVVMTNPFTWPYVRRGSERVLHDLSSYLHSRGHRVTVIAMAPHEGVEERDGVTYRLLRQRFSTPFRQFNSCHYFAMRLQGEIAGLAPDAVFGLNYFDAYAALRARARCGRRFGVGFLAVGIPVRRYFRAVPLDAFFIREVLAHVDLRAVLSTFARDALRNEFGQDAQVLPPPVQVDDFVPARPPRAASSAGPRILFVGDVNEPRKGAQALCEAFAIVRREHPRAELILSGSARPATQAMLRALPALRSLKDDAAVRFLGVGRVADLPGLYQQASVTVLPAVWEAFGLVLVESLAAGTPVVGARHGGIPDIIDSDRVGRLFDPMAFRGQARNAAGLAAAILAVLAQGKAPDIREACRARATAFGWAALGPRYEQAISAIAA